MSSYTRHFLRSSAVILLLNVLGGIIGYITRVFYGRILTVEQFGMLYAILNFVIFIVAFKNFGLGESLSKFIPEFKVKKKIKDIYKMINFTFAVQMGIITVLFSIIFLFSEFFAVHYFHTIEATGVLRLVLIGFWFNCIVDVFSSAFMGNQNMATYASIQFIKTAVILAVSLMLFYLNFGFRSAVCANSLFAIILLIVYAPIFLIKFPKIYLYGLADKRLSKKVMIYALPLIVGSFGAIGISFTDTFLLTYLAGLRDVALYNVAWPTAYFLMFFALTFVAVLMPLVSELWTRKRPDLIALGMNKIYKYFFVLLLPIALVFIVYSKQIILILFEDKFLPASTALMILSVGFIFMNFASVTITAINGIGKSRLGAKVLLISAAANLIGNAALIPFYGFVGAAIGTSICYLTMFILGIIFLKKNIDIQLPLRSWVNTTLIGAMFIVLVEIAKRAFQVNIPSMLCVVFAATMVYAALILLFRVVTIEEIKETYALLVKKS
jgi:O-antigen/teichoic acid export membrane protein